MSRILYHDNMPVRLAGSNEKRMYIMQAVELHRTGKCPHCGKTSFIRASAPTAYSVGYYTSVPKQGGCCLPYMTEELVNSPDLVSCSLEQCLSAL